MPPEETPSLPDTQPTIELIEVPEYAPRPTEISQPKHSEVTSGMRDLQEQIDTLSEQMGTAEDNHRSALSEIGKLRLQLAEEVRQHKENLRRVMAENAQLRMENERLRALTGSPSQPADQSLPIAPLGSEPVEEERTPEPDESVEPEEEQREQVRPAKVRRKKRRKPAAEPANQPTTIARQPEKPSQQPKRTAEELRRLIALRRQQIKSLEGNTRRR